MTQETFQITGMHCASCSSLITKKLKKIEGIKECNVNYATEKAQITFDPQAITLSSMNIELNKMGYSLSENTSEVRDKKHQLNLQQSKVEKNVEHNILKNKIAFTLPISLFVFGLMLWDMSTRYFHITNLKIPMEIMNPILFILATMFLLLIGKPYLEAIKRFTQYKIANMDTLVGIGTLTAYGYSSILFLFPNLITLLSLPEYLYFDVAIVVLGFISFGKYLEAKSKRKTGEAIEKLLHLQAKTALVKRDGKEVVIPLQQVTIGDLIIVKQGAKVPVDGVITEGNPTIDESMINGEPLPKDKSVGDYVIGSTINKKGIFTFKAKSVGSETMLSQIIKMVEKAQGSKIEIQNFADNISSIFVPTVLIIAIVTVISWLTLGTYFLGFSNAISYAIVTFVSVLVIACPCALGLATPTAIIVGVGKGAENGILIKNAQSLERLQKVTTLVFDKTGTITNGQPEVSDIISLTKHFSREMIMRYALSLEKNSQHPIAESIVHKAITMHVTQFTVHNFEENEGIGIRGVINDKNIELVKPDKKDVLMKEYIDLQSQGKIVVALKVNGTTVGLISISDTIKTKTKSVIKELQALKIQTLMLTGDTSTSAQYIAKQINIDAFKADVMPQDKSEIIKNLQKDGKIVAMVGDGINDAPALSQANVGIAMATGTDIAIESADITILGGEISKIPQAIKLSKYTLNTIKQNLFWAFIYNSIGIPLASGILYPFFGILLNPVFAGGAMAMSSVSVITNSLLLKKRKI